MKALFKKPRSWSKKDTSDAARNLLEQFTKAYPDHDSQQVGALLYFIYRGIGDIENAIGTCEQQLSLMPKALTRSTWLLRRGLLNCAIIMKWMP